VDRLIQTRCIETQYAEVHTQHCIQLAFRCRGEQRNYSKFTAGLCGTFDKNGHKRETGVLLYMTTKSCRADETVVTTRDVAGRNVTGTEVGNVSRQTATHPAPHYYGDKAHS